MALRNPETSEFLTASGVSSLRRFEAVILLCLSILAVGCSPTASENAPQYGGTFEASCSPVDAPAIAFDLIRLGGAEPPQVGFLVWSRLDPAGVDIDLSGSGGSGAAHVGGTEWIPASFGVLHIDQYKKGVLSSGWFWIELGGVKRIEGRFEAVWRDTGPTFCG